MCRHVFDRAYPIGLFCLKTPSGPRYIDQKQGTRNKKKVRVRSCQPAISRKSARQSKSTIMPRASRTSPFVELRTHSLPETARAVRATHELRTHPLPPTAQAVNAAHAVTIKYIASSKQDSRSGTCIILSSSLKTGFGVFFYSE